MSRSQPTTLRERASRLGWLTALLGGISGLLIVGAVLTLLSRSGRATRAPTLPLGLLDALPGGGVVLAAAFGLAGTFVGVAALDTAAAMRILSRTRRQPRRPRGRRS